MMSHVCVCVDDDDSCLEKMNSINDVGCDHVRRMCTSSKKRVMRNMHTCDILYSKHSFLVRLNFGIANSDSAKRACVRSVLSFYCKNKNIKCVGSAYRFDIVIIHSFLIFAHTQCV